MKKSKILAFGFLFVVIFSMTSSTRAYTPVKVGDFMVWENTTAGKLNSATKYEVTAWNNATGATVQETNYYVADDVLNSSSKAGAFIALETTIVAYKSLPGAIQSNATYGGKKVLAISVGNVTYDTTTGTLLEKFVNNSQGSYTMKLVSWTDIDLKPKYGPADTTDDSSVPGYPIWIIGVASVITMIAIIRKHRK
jgi:hypothetical protein